MPAPDDIGLAAGTVAWDGPVGRPRRSPSASAPGAGLCRRIFRRPARAAWLALLLAAAPARAAAPASGPVPASDLAAAREAVRDEIYDLAARKLETLIPASATGSVERGEAVLLLAGVYEAQSRFEDMTALLARHETEAAGTPREPAWQAARAAADAGAGRVAAALRRVSDLEQRFPDSPELARARRLRGWCLVRLGRLDEALAAFAAFDKLQVGTPEVAANRLAWARALLDAGRLDEAARVLEDPAPFPAAGALAEERRLILAEIAAGRREDGRAEESLSSLVESRAARESTRAAALFLLAEIRERQTNGAAALATLQQGGERLKDPGLREEARLREGMLLLRLGRPEEGIARVRAFVSVNTTNDAARGVQLALAKALLDRGLSEESAEEYQYYLEAFSDPAGVIQALKGRGWALFQLGRYSEASEAFKKGRALAVSAADREWFLVKLGDCHFANAQYQQAREAYQQALKEFPGSAQADLLRFQAMDCRARLGEALEAQAELMGLAETAADAAIRERALLRAADLKARQGRFLESLDLYRRILEQKPGEPTRASARHAMGLLQYRLGQFREALGNFERVVYDSPGHESAEQALIMCAWCHFMMDDPDQALDIFETFRERYPASASLPDVIFWLGEFEYNLGLYASAERRFAELARRFPASPLADSALFWAGRAAFMQKEFRRANEYVVTLLQLKPQSPRRAEARFYQAEALCELADFSAAILLYDEIIKQFPDSHLWDLSWCRKGDCQYTLGPEDPRRYEEAMASYQVVLDRTDAPRELRLRAEYCVGRCLEKLERREKAFERYMGVVYKYVEDRERNTPDCDVWFTRAAFHAAEMKEAEKSWRAAVNLYQRVVDARVTAAPDAVQRIQKIRLEHWLFFY